MKSKVITLSSEILEGPVRYKNCVIVPAGNAKFPSLVEIEKAPVRLGIKGKKFINAMKAQLIIDTIGAELMIGGGVKKVKAELDTIGFISEEDTAW
jgi:hypothetical protein|tara:strand:- start:1168 stop:1455 length:288 start_codon:yes stop_codon:yes gene_type:complete